MICELRGHFAEMATRLATERGMLAIGRTDFSAALSPIVTHAITGLKTYKYINDCYRIDIVNIRASRETFCHLAVAILAVVFCPEMPELLIRIENPESQIRSLKIRYQGTTHRAVFKYLTAPHSFEYHPSDLAEHPWLQRREPEMGWPEFLLTYSGPHAEAHWEERDMIEGFGNDDAAVLVASLLLDFVDNKIIRTS